MDKETNKTASIQMPVPGRQTIPRAELWAIVCLANEMDEDADCKTYIDSSYVVAGLSRTELKNELRKWRNGDLWTLLFRLIQDKNISRCTTTWLTRWRATRLRGT